MLPEVFLPLSRGLVAVIDFDDFERVGRIKWSVSKRLYVRRRDKSNSRRQILLHREIMNCPAGLQVDHINGDTLDNRKSNLRIVTASQNRRAFRRRKTGTSSQFRGVRWNKRHKKWRAFIRLQPAPAPQEYLGAFISEEDAARAYDAAALKYFGEFACLNFPIDNKNQKSN